MNKELSLATEQDDPEKQEKKADNDLQDKKEYFYSSVNTSVILYIPLSAMPATHYAIHYISNHYYQIIAPPPDFLLHA